MLSAHICSSKPCVGGRAFTQASRLPVLPQARPSLLRNSYHNQQQRAVRLSALQIQAALGASLAGEE